MVRHSHCPSTLATSLRLDVARDALSLQIAQDSDTFLFYANLAQRLSSIVVWARQSVLTEVAVVMATGTPAILIQEEINVMQVESTVASSGGRTYSCFLQFGTTH